MKRRDFLKLSTVTGAATALPFYAPTKLFAAHDNYSGPLYLLIDARGGWDPTSLCDPKGYTPGQAQNRRINNYPKAKIGTTPGGIIKYAPPPDAFLASTPTSPAGPLYDPTLYSNRQFFDKYHQKLLIINGINAGTVSHSDGRRYNWSGELARTGFPNFGALVAGTLASGRDIPFITNGGGYEESAGLVVPVRLNTKGISAIFEIAYTNSTDPKLANGSNRYFQPAVNKLINAGRDARLEKLLAAQRLPRIKNAINSLKSSRQVSGDLKNLALNLSDTANFPEKPKAFFNGRDKARALYQQGRIALAAYQTGVSATAQLSLAPFDTHSNHDVDHYPILMDFLQGIDAILEEAAARGLTDKIVVMIASDFGRTNKYNEDAGKDHWPITSMMFIGNSQQIIQGNRVIGGTTNQHKAINIDPVTLNLDPSNTNNASIKLTPAHIHFALRKLAGVDQTQAAFDYPVGTTDINLFNAI